MHVFSLHRYSVSCVRSFIVVLLNRKSKMHVQPMLILCSVENVSLNYSFVLYDQTPTIYTQEESDL